MPPKSSTTIDEAPVDELIPGRIRRFLGANPAIGLENGEDFEDLLTSHVIDFGYRDTLEIFDINDIASKQFELRRLKEIRLAVIEKNLPRAAADLMGAAYLAVADVKDMEKVDIYHDFQSLFRQVSNGDQSAKAVLENLARASGITNRALISEAYILSLKTIVHLDETIARHEQSLTKLIKSFQKRRDTLGAMNKSLLRPPAVLDEVSQSSEVSSEDDAQ